MVARSANVSRVAETSSSASSKPYGTAPGTDADGDAMTTPFGSDQTKRKDAKAEDHEDEDGDDGPVGSSEDGELSPDSRPLLDPATAVAVRDDLFRVCPAFTLHPWPAAANSNPADLPGGSGGQLERRDLTGRLASRTGLAIGHRAASAPLARAYVALSFDMNAEAAMDAARICLDPRTRCSGLTLIIQVRDPRDVIVSGMYFHRRCSEEWWVGVVGGGRFERWLGGLGGYTGIPPRPPGPGLKPFHLPHLPFPLFKFCRINRPGYEKGTNASYCEVARRFAEAGDKEGALNAEIDMSISQWKYLEAMVDLVQGCRANPLLAKLVHFVRYEDMFANPAQGGC